MPAPIRPGQRYFPHWKLADYVCQIVIDALEGKEKKILELRFGSPGMKGMTQKETGEVLGMSEARVGQLEQKALARVSKYIKQAKVDQILPDYKTPISTLKLPTRVENNLYNAKIRTVEYLCEFSSTQLSLFPGLGGKALQHIRTALNKRELALTEAAHCSHSYARKFG